MFDSLMVSSVDMLLVHGMFGQNLPHLINLEASLSVPSWTTNLTVAILGNRPTYTGGVRKT